MSMKSGLRLPFQKTIVNEYTLGGIAAYVKPINERRAPLNARICVYRDNPNNMYHRNLPILYSPFEDATR